MLIGIGADITRIRRFDGVRTGFLDKVYTAAELEIYHERGESLSFLAANFTGKEAVAKALGTGFHGFSPSDIEILRNPLGKPVVKLYAGALAVAEAKGVSTVHISLTDTDEYAAAFVVIE